MQRDTQRRFRDTAAELEFLARGCVDLIQPSDLERKLAKSRATGVPLRVKLGLDPTAPDIHLGHTVVLRKLRDFQDLGHTVFFVVGDFTARIGDPTGRSKTRPRLGIEEIRTNAVTYTAQAFHVLDRSRTEVVFNGEWLDALRSSDWIELAARYNVARMLERRDFRQRFDSGQTISLHEFLYPLVQAYDSVHLKADVELGGTDQLFNLNVGRDVMPGFGLEAQVVMTTPLLEGLDGVEKMSKSLGNTVGITDAPLDMFGKLMSISDDLMWRYYELLTDLDGAGIASLRQGIAAGDRHPKEVKADLARRIVTTFHSADAATGAQTEWERIFSGREIPAEMDEIRQAVSEEPLWLPRALVDAGLAKSTSEVLRTIRQGGVEVDGRRLGPDDAGLDASRPGEHVVRFGKRRFVRIVVG